MAEITFEFTAKVTLHKIDLSKSRRIIVKKIEVITSGTEGAQKELRKRKLYMREFFGGNNYNGWHLVFSKFILDESVTTSFFQINRTYEIKAEAKEFSMFIDNPLEESVKGMPEFPISSIIVTVEDFL